MAPTPLAAAREALAGIVNPRVGQDLLAAGMVEGLVIGDDGRPTFTFLLRRDDPATLVRQIRQAFQAADLPDPRIQIKDPSGPAMTRSTASSSARLSMSCALLRAVSSAASFSTFARSAPVNPGVLRASTSRSTPSAIGLP
mgnify:CR=1 FL=1